MSTQNDTVRYELMVIVSPDIGETAIKKRLDAIRKSVSDFGGEIFFEDVWGLRNLAYEIKKHDQGYYAVLDINLEPKYIKELDRILRLEVEVLRHLLMKLPNYYQPKSLSEMEAENAAEEEKREAMKEEKKSKFAPAKTARKAELPKEEKKEEKPVKSAKKSEESEEAPKKTSKKKDENKKDLQDIDAKLDSILSNPDINF